MRKGTAWVIVLSLAGQCENLHAGSVCDAYRANNRKLYESLCGGGGGGSRPAGAQSSFAESFGLNAAAISTEPSSYGMEVIYSAIKTDLSKSQTNYGLVKGFKRLGTGFTNSENNTFYNNDILRRRYSDPELKNFAPLESPQKKSNYSLGAAFDLLSLGDLGVLKVGGLAKYNRYSDTIGGGPAVLLSTYFLSVGGGFVREKIAANLPRINFISTLVGLRLYIFELEYNRLIANDPFNLSPVHIGTLNVRIDNLTLIAAVKKLKFYRKDWITQHHYAIQYLFGKYFSIGYMDNYIPGARSLGLQIFL